jgi:hypothetical protein
MADNLYLFFPKIQSASNGWLPTGKNRCWPNAFAKHVYARASRIFAFGLASFGFASAVSNMEVGVNKNEADVLEGSQKRYRKKRRRIRHSVNLTEQKVAMTICIKDLFRCSGWGRVMRTALVIVLAVSVLSHSGVELGEAFSSARATWPSPKQRCTTSRCEKAFFRPYKLHAHDTVEACAPLSAPEVSVNTRKGITIDRRSWLRYSFAISTTLPACSTFIILPAAAEVTPVDGIMQQVKLARTQLDIVPSYIQAEQWDKVRAVLITSPVSDFWTKSSSSTSPSLLLQLSELVDEEHELDILDLRQDLLNHLRYLDMAVYNNVFNPITTMGKTGASKELIQSYYDDPTNEYNAVLKTLDEIITIGSPAKTKYE